mmetsp:Transcript_21442/g.51110  ORF Transcript_21442/g.51110 Transcript_21442/m.51110 type:complete len:608 (+) Transcript_21442:404-2227(+)
MRTRTKTTTTTTGSDDATIVEPVVVLRFDYAYDPLKGNSNALSLASLAGNRSDPFRSTLEKFVSYYGSTGYDNDWIRSAFRGNPTPGFAFSFNDIEMAVDMDFSVLDREARHGALRTGIVVLKLWIFVVESLEEAVAVCAMSSRSIDPAAASYAADALIRWDRAVAAYTGSRPIIAHPDDGDGYFLYGLVSRECKRFGTCATSSATMAPLNRDVLTAFRDGRESLRVGNCFGAGSHARRTADKMSIPLVQGVLRNAYALDIEENFAGSVQGEVAAYAAAILPLLHDCSVGKAFQIYEDLVPGKAAGTSYEVLKDLIERSYPCLGISCADVGGLVTEDGDSYLPGAGPCGVEERAKTDAASDTEPAPWEVTARNRNSLSGTESLIVGISIGSGIVVGVLVAVLIRYKSQVASFLLLSFPGMQRRRSGGGDGGGRWWSPLRKSRAAATAKDVVGGGKQKPSKSSSHQGFRRESASSDRTPRITNHRSSSSFGQDGDRNSNSNSNSNIQKNQRRRSRRSKQSSGGGSSVGESRSGGLRLASQGLTLHDPDSDEDSILVLDEENWAGPFGSPTPSREEANRRTDEERGTTTADDDERPIPIEDDDGGEEPN